MKKFISLFSLLLWSTILAHEKVPVAYRAYSWVNFCSHHLQIDPEGCSSWVYMTNTKKEKNYFPEEKKFILFPFCSISPQLIDTLQNIDGLERTPVIPDSQCDYAICTICKQKLIRSFIWKESIIEETSKCYRTASTGEILYKCACTDGFIDKKDPIFQNIVLHWEFCHHPACYSGYFDKYMSAYFEKFYNFSQYCSENPTCDCYWFETSEFRKKIVDLIYERYWNEILKGTVLLNSYSTIPSDIAEKMLLYPKRKLLEHLVHSFFYSDLKKSLEDFDQSILYKDFGEYWLDNPVSHAEWKAFCKRLFTDLRPLFIEQYKICYGLHPHPKIHAEIKAIHDDINE